VDLGPQGAWIKDLGWGWGLILFAAIVLPWAMMITVATDGAFWGDGRGGDLAPKLAGGQEGHGAPFGYHALARLPAGVPATLLLPAGLVQGWTGRREPGVRFAVCWLIPTWLMFEILPTKLVHYTLPAYGALAMLMAAAVREPLGKLVRMIGAGLSVLAGLLLAAVAVYGKSSTATRRPGLDHPDRPAVPGRRRRRRGAAAAQDSATALVAAGALGIAAHAALVGLPGPAAGAAVPVQGIGDALDRPTCRRGAARPAPWRSPAIPSPA
jgi:hypothetical protein